MRILIVLAMVFTFFVAAPAFSQGEEFQDFPWNTAIIEIVGKKGKPDALVPGRAIYQTRIADKLYEKLYIFTHEGIFQIVLIFKDTPDKNIEYVREFNRLKNELTSLYGTPRMPMQVWYNEIYEGLGPMKGEAVALGHLILGADWVAGDTYIELVLRKKDGKPFLTVLFEKLTPELREQLSELKKKISEQMAKTQEELENK